MSVSNSSNFTVNRDELIRSAFEMVGVSVVGEDLDPGDVSKANITLNMMLKAFQQHGLQVWKRETVSIAFVESQASYTLGQKSKGTATSDSANELIDDGADFVTDSVIIGDIAHNTTDGTSAAITGITDQFTLTFASDLFPDGDENYTITSADVSTGRPLKIVEATRKDTSGNLTTMNPLTYEEYDNLPNKTNEGTPISYFYEPTLNNGTLYVWQTPDAASVTNYTLDITTYATINDMDSPTDDFDCPSEWLEALTANLALRLSFRYPLATSYEHTKLNNFAEDTLELAIGFGNEDGSLYLHPSEDY